MFRIEYLRVNRHPQLGTINLSLSEIKEIDNISKPYTSVIIGANGTGKSFILRTISDIFTQFQIFQTTGVRDINLPYGFHIRYILDGDIYEIISYLKDLSKTKERKTFLFFKNRPFNFQDISLESLSEVTPYVIPFQNVLFPSHVIVNSVMLNDRFLFRKSEPDDFYQYLGVRATSSTASTKSAVKGVINKLFSESLTNENFLKNLGELLNFLEFENKFEVEYNTKLNKLFFTGKLTVKDFKQYYTYWWDEEFKYSNRREDNPIWSKPFYDNFYESEEAKIEEIVNYLNELSTSGKLVPKYNSTSQLLKIDFFGNRIEEDELWKIIDLEKLDIINVNGINLKKNQSNLEIGDISSGEYHLLISLIGIFSKIKQNALVMIDEPEISLHPNWQMQYITFLKKVFSKCASCHFIVTSHSHFIVSDLEGDSSSVTALKRTGENMLQANLLDINTYGWSAEEILLEVFNAPTSRNLFIYEKIGDIMELISRKEREPELITEKVNELLSKNVFELSENDPLNGVWTKIVNKYATRS